MAQDHHHRFEHVASGVSGHIGEYDVFISGDSVQIVEDTENDPTTAEREIDGLAEFIEEADEFRLGWGELPDFEVIYLYDAADGNYGYAVNLDSPMLSEWGYAPFDQGAA